MNSLSNMSKSRWFFEALGGKSKREIRGGGEVFIRKIRLIEGIAKCRHLKIFSGKGTLRNVFICLRLRTLYTLPHLTSYTLYACIQYTYSPENGGRGGESWTRENRREGQKFTKLDRKYQHDWLYLQSINSDKPQSLFTGKIFLDDDSLLWCLLS
jgi:hypothetical protein